MPQTPDFAHDIAALKSLIEGTAGNLHELRNLVVHHDEAHGHQLDMIETQQKLLKLQDTQLDGFEERLGKLEDAIIHLHGIKAAATK